MVNAAQAEYPAQRFFLLFFQVVSLDMYAFLQQWDMAVIMLQIVAIDLLLGGDNAVVIAMACRKLPPQKRTKAIVIGTVGAILARILLLAIALSENHRVNRWLRTAFFFPMIIPMVSAAALWLFIFMPGLGLLDHYLAKLFGPMNNNWLGRSNSALLALALIGVWKFAGYYMLFFLAGLQSIPASTREAALMEGATRTQVFFKVTLPLLRPTLSFVITTALIYSITQIDHVAVMTRGGPDNATTVLLYYIQNLAWDTHDLGKASAATFLSLAGLFAFSLINLKLLEKGAHYER